MNGMNRRRERSTSAPPPPSPVPKASAALLAWMTLASVGAVSQFRRLPMRVGFYRHDRWLTQTPDLPAAPPPPLVVLSLFPRRLVFSSFTSTQRRSHLLHIFAGSHVRLRRQRRSFSVVLFVEMWASDCSAARPKTFISAAKISGIVEDRDADKERLAGEG